MTQFATHLDVYNYKRIGSNVYAVAYDLRTRHSSIFVRQAYPLGRHAYRFYEYEERDGIVMVDRPNDEFLRVSFEVGRLPVRAIARSCRTFHSLRSLDDGPTPDDPYADFTVIGASFPHAVPDKLFEEATVRCMGTSDKKAATPVVQKMVLTKVNEWLDGEIEGYPAPRGYVNVARLVALGSVYCFARAAQYTREAGS